jgi:hypothetical protein
MSFQSSMGPKNQGVTIINGTTQVNSYPIHIDFFKNNIFWVDIGHLCIILMILCYFCQHYAF